MSDARSPSFAAEGGLSRYLQRIRQYPLLGAEEEMDLAVRWRRDGDITAADRLVTSHLRLVTKIAMGYRGYGLPVNELISEGNVGMLQAVRRFDPDRGFRLATYAMWWIRAAIQEYILRSWSLVKIGTTAAQKKLFFNLRKLKGRLRAIDDGDLKPEMVSEIATCLNVPESEVVNMNWRLAGNDHSLNAPIQNEGEAEWLDLLVDPSLGQEFELGEQQELDHRRRMLDRAMDRLTPRERRILVQRRLQEDPSTLEVLSKEFGVSRERVRQIEVRAFEKVQKSVKRIAGHGAQIPADFGAEYFPVAGDAPRDVFDA